MIPKIVYEGLTIKGDFEFTRSKVILDVETFEPSVTISFKFNPNIRQSFMDTEDVVKCNEMLAEKLKQDFIKYLDLEFDAE